MLIRTSSAHAPWICAHNDDKKPGRVSLIRHLLHTVAPKEIRDGVAPPDPAIVFPFSLEAMTDGRLAK